MVKNIFKKTRFLPRALLTNSVAVAAAFGLSRLPW